MQDSNMKRIMRSAFLVKWITMRSWGKKIIFYQKYFTLKVRKMLILLRNSDFSNIMSLWISIFLKRLVFELNITNTCSFLSSYVIRLMKIFSVWDLRIAINSKIKLNVLTYLNTFISTNLWGYPCYMITMKTNLHKK